MKVDPSLHYTQKATNYKWIRELNVVAKTMKPLEENRGINLRVLGLGNDLDMRPKTQN